MKKARFPPVLIVGVALLTVTMIPASFASHTGTGLADASESVGFEALAMMDPAQEAYLLDPFVQEMLNSDVLSDIVEERGEDEGFLSVVPAIDPAPHLALAYQGSAPDEAHEYAKSAEDPTIIVSEHVEPEALAYPLDEGGFTFASQEDVEGPLAPGPTEGIGPGTPLSISRPDGTFGCSANFVFQDPATERAYLGTAGHCVLSGGMSNTTDAAWDPAEVTVSYCEQPVVSGGATLCWSLQELGDVVYASQDDGAGNGFGFDFAIIEIPFRFVEGVDLGCPVEVHDKCGEVRPWLPVWGGPTGDTLPGLGDPAVHYGHGLGHGTAMATEARAAATLGSYDDGSWDALGWVTGGDSGSGIATADARTDHLLVGDEAFGTITHSITGIGAPLMLGTTVEKGLDLVQTETGLKLDLVLEDQVLEAPDVVAGFTSECEWLECAFNASKTFVKGDVDAYEWDLGDGETATGENVTHAYETEGTFTVTLTVTDAQGNQDSMSLDVTVEAFPEDAEERRTDLALEESYVGAGQVVIFPGLGGGGVSIGMPTQQEAAQAATTDAEENDETFVEGTAEVGDTIDLAVEDDSGEPVNGWYQMRDASDDTVSEGPLCGSEEGLPLEANVTEVLVFLGDAQNALAGLPCEPATQATTGTVTADLEVSYLAVDKPLEAQFTTDCAELTCSFDASESTGNITSYAWTFGDGNTGTGEVVDHTYDAPGAYTVELTVTDEEDETNTTSQEVAFDDPITLYLRSCCTGVGNVDVVFENGTTMSEEAPTAQEPAHWYSNPVLAGANPNTIYDANWAWTPEDGVDLGGATVTVTFFTTSPGNLVALNGWAIELYADDELVAEREGAEIEPTSQALDYSEYQVTLEDVDASGSTLTLQIHPFFVNLDGAHAIAYDAEWLPSNVHIS